MATPAELLTGNPLAIIESLATTGNQIAPRVTASPAATGQIVQSRARPGMKNVTGTATTVRPNALPGGTPRPAGPGVASRVASGLVRGGVIGAATTPKVAESPTVAGAIRARLEAGESAESIEADFGAGSVGDSAFYGDFAPQIAANAVQEFAQGPQIDKLSDQPVNFNVQPAPAVQGAAEFVTPQDVVGYGTMQNANGTFTAMLPYGGNVKGFATEEAALAAIDESYASKGIGGRAEADQLMAQDEVNPLPGRQEFDGSFVDQADAVRGRWAEMTTPEERSQYRDELASLPPEARRSIFEDPQGPVALTPEIANAITRFSQAKYLGEQDEARAASGQVPGALSKDPVELRTQARDQQASYEEFKAGGGVMTQAKSDQAYKNAQARGTTWDPEVGYGDAPQVVVDNMKNNLSKAINTSFKNGWIFDADGREKVDSMMEIVENYPRDGRQDQAAINSLKVLMGELNEMGDVPADAKAEIGTILSAGVSSGLPTNPRPIVKAQNESAAFTTEQAAPAVAPVDPGFNFFKNPSVAEAQNILETQPTDSAQRARLEAIIRGEGGQSALGAVESFLLDPAPATSNVRG